MLHQLFRKKDIDSLHADAESAHLQSGMRKVLRVKDLTMMGVAAVIGAGIFSTIGTAAYNGGPGVIFLFIITAVTCGFTALCYAEFASRVPVSGSAYTYSYVTFGEVVAWIIGWALILEYSIGNIVVAISWSAYCNNLLQAAHIYLPDWLTIGYQTAKAAYDEALLTGQDVSSLVYTHAPVIGGIHFIVNLPAFLIVVFITVLAYIGISESKESANFMVGLKLVVLAFIAVVGFWIIFTEDKMSNWSPFLPNGMTGVLRGVSSVFFAYIGFDAISTTAEECANPKRDLPRGMIYSLIICTVIYVVTTLVITGLVNYSSFKGVTDPLAFVFDQINMKKIGFFISVTAVVASTSVLLVFQIGQPRIWMSMSRDGLLPARFSKISRKRLTPGFATIVTGLLVGIPSLFIDDLLMTDLTSIGTLFAFVLVCGGVLLLPRVRKESGFQLPYVNGKWIIPMVVIVFLLISHHRLTTAFANLGAENFEEALFLLFAILAMFLAVYTFIRNFSLIPMLGVLCCLYLMIEIPVKSWIVFFCWMLAGLVIYLFYGKRHSILNKTKVGE